MKHEANIDLKKSVRSTTRPSPVQTAVKVTLLQKLLLRERASKRINRLTK